MNTKQTHNQHSNTPSVIPQDEAIESAIDLPPTSKAELAQLLDNIEQLRIFLHRLSTLVEGEASEIVAQARDSLEIVRIEVDNVFKLQIIEYKEQLLTWEDEGGNVIDDDMV